MSAKTWIEEFCPITASQVTSDGALGHSIRKWTGLLKENRQKHDLRKYKSTLIDVNGFTVININGDTCALCKHYDCYKCPLYKILGEAPCDLHDESPYFIYIRTGNPVPMLNALNKAKQMEDNNGKDSSKRR
jgi:hypothetical protein